MSFTIPAAFLPGKSSTNELLPRLRSWLPNARKKAWQLLVVRSLSDAGPSGRFRPLDTLSSSASSSAPEHHSHSQVERRGLRLRQERLPCRAPSRSCGIHLHPSTHPSPVRQLYSCYSVGARNSHRFQEQSRGLF